MSTNKYHVAPAAARTIDGILFDSKAEMRRYLELRLLLWSGNITGLVCQPEYVLLAPFTAAGRRFRGIKYIPDFQYTEAGKIVVEDVKGIRTQVYQLKRQMMAKLFPDVIFREIKVGR